MAAFHLPSTGDEMCEDRVVPSTSPPLPYWGMDDSGLLCAPLGLSYEAVALRARKSRSSPMPCVKAHEPLPLGYVKQPVCVCLRSRRSHRLLASDSLRMRHNGIQVTAKDKPVACCG